MITERSIQREATMGYYIFIRKRATQVFAFDMDRMAQNMEI